MFCFELVALCGGGVGTVDGFDLGTEAEFAELLGGAEAQPGGFDVLIVVRSGVAGLTESAFCN